MTEGNRPQEDIGAAHVLDRILHLACRPWQDGTYGPRHAPAPTTARYLDAEEEREGIYR